MPRASNPKPAIEKPRKASASSAGRGSKSKRKQLPQQHQDQEVKSGLGQWLGMERNQVLYSQVTEQYYFVPIAQRLGREGMLRVKGKKINVTSSVKPLLAHAIATHLRKMARSSKIYPSEKYNLLNEAKKVEKKAGIDASDPEG